jgi:hypothetical protein
LGDNFWDANDLLTDEEVSLLDAPLSEQEIFNVVKSSYVVGAPGPWVLASVLSNLLVSDQG